MRTPSSRRRRASLRLRRSRCRRLRGRVLRSIARRATGTRATDAVARLARELVIDVRCGSARSTKCFALCSDGVSSRPSASASSNALLASTSGSTCRLRRRLRRDVDRSRRARTLLHVGLRQRAARSRAARTRGVAVAGQIFCAERLGARVLGQHGANALDGRARVVETALLERGLAAAHEIVRHFRQDRRALRCCSAPTSRTRANSVHALYSSGSIEHAGSIRELRHAQRVVERASGARCGGVAGSCLDLGRQCRRRRRPTTSAAACATRRVTRRWSRAS